MPITFDIDPGRGLILTKATGVVTGAEILELKKRLVADPRFSAELRSFADLRGITDLQVSPADVNALLEFDRSHPGCSERIRLGLLAGSDVVYGMARMYEMRSQRENGIAVFRREADLWAWLDQVCVPAPA